MMATPHPVGIPRSIYLGRILYLCFFPVFTVLLGNLALLFVPQAQEALLAFPHQGVNWPSAWFTFAFLVWMISAWYVARILVGRRFEPDLVGECVSATFAKRVTDHLPRILALFAGLPIAIWLIWNGEERGLGILLLVLALIVLVALVFRRGVADRRGWKWREAWKRRPGEQFERISGVGRGAFSFIVALFVLSFGVFLVLPVWMEGPARVIGSAALLLLALMSWTIFGGFLLTYVPKAYGYPALTWIPLLLVLISWLWNENHPVAPAGRQTPPIADDRPMLRDAFARWLRTRPDKNAPVIFVSSAGGASRAAFWTTATLGLLEDEAKLRHGAFADNVFVINSISGGSLGAAAFVASVEASRAYARAARSEPTSDVAGSSRAREASQSLRPTSEQSEENPHCTSALALGNALTGRDHLAGVVGMLLFPDLVARFVPLPIEKFDRSRALEEVWARDWDDVTKACQLPPDAHNRWTQTFLSLPYGRPDRPGYAGLPALSLTTSAIGAGRVVLQAPFKVSRVDEFDLFSDALGARSLTLTQAVHNSARFPYVSPVGLVRMNNQEDHWDRLADGGYVEASGTLVLKQMLDELSEAGLIRGDDETPNCADETGQCFVRHADLRILVLDNVPATRGSWSCNLDRTGSDRRHQADLNDAHAAKPYVPFLETTPPPLPDLTAPLAGALAARGGRGVSSEFDLVHFAGATAGSSGCDTRNYAELRFPKVLERTRHARDPSMNWMLNEASRDSMVGALKTALCSGDANGKSESQQLLRLNLQIAFSWLVRSDAPVSLETSQICRAAAATSAIAPPGTRP